MTPLFSFILRRSPALTPIFGIVLLLLTACALPESGAAATSKPPTFTVVSDDGNQVLPEVTNNALTIDITSAQGMGNTTVTRQDGAWPQRIVLHLHLAGLERLEITADATTVMAEVSSTSPPNIIQQTSTVDAMQAITADHPLWLSITAPTDEHAYYEVILPSQLHAAIEQTLHIAWIDFYR